MNRPELFTKTYNTLVTAWEKGDLKHGDCTGCAVGNICTGERYWPFAFTTRQRATFHDQQWKREGFPESTFEHFAVYQIGETGYKIAELAKVEHAFEIAIARDYENLRHTSEGQYIGLCAVMEILWEIHEVEDQSLVALNKVATAKGVTVNA